MVSQESPQRPYDAFVSYSRTDREWVDSCLLTPLERAGLKVLIDHRDFDIGVPSIVNMERAVEQSRHTLVVLTPAWVASQWTDFESLLVATEDPIGRRRRLIPLLVLKCDLPPRLRILSYADFTEPRHYQAQLARVIRSLTPPDHTAAPGPSLSAATISALVTADPIQRGVETLNRLVETPAVRAAAVRFDVLFRDAAARIDVMASYKDIHDLLHTLQLRCYDMIVQELAVFPQDQLACDNLATHALTFESTLQALQEIATRQPLPEHDTGWIARELVPALGTLKSALDLRDRDLLRRTAWAIDRVLAIRPSLVNARLSDSARTLPLPALHAALATILEAIRAVASARPHIEAFESGVVALDKLSRRLETLVRLHDGWQAVDLEMRRLSAGLGHAAGELEYCWPDLERQLTALSTVDADGPSSPRLAEEGQRMQQALCAADLARVRSSFRLLRHIAVDRFYRVDLKLKRQCDELRKIGAPLAALVRIVE